MNTPIAIAAGITGLAFLAHTFVGLREVFSIAPAKLAPASAVPNFPRADLLWAQSVCAFQLVSIDLLAHTVLLAVLAFTDILAPAREIALAVGGLYVLRAVVWLAQLAYLRRRIADYVSLGQWMAFLGGGALILWGASFL